MQQQRKTFRAIEVGDGGDGRWAAYARGLWPEMEGLLTEEGRTPEGADRVRALFRAHMPELVPVLDRLAAQLDRSEAEAFLWPDESWQQSFVDFKPGSRTVTLGRAG